jgi:RHS repeat-associated protein
MGCLKLTYREIPEADFFLSSEKTIGDAGNRSFWDVKSDHLGNVRVVLSDARNSVGLTSVTAAYDYFPFGMMMPGRQISEGYRYGFNGYENDNEIKGSGNSYDFGLRCYDPRLARMMKVDPRAREYAWQTTYAYHRNSPIARIDFLGGGDSPDPNAVHKVEAGNTLTSIANTYHTTIEAIKNVNLNIDWTKRGKNQDVIYAGETLKIPEKDFNAEKVRPNILRRTEWGAAQTNGTDYATVKNPEQTNDYIAIHHAGNTNSPSMKDAQKQHLKKGWHDIGYHFGIDLKGNIYEGRSIFKRGAGVGRAELNGGVISIVILGDMQSNNWNDWSNDQLTLEAKTSLIGLVNYLVVKYSIEYVGGHQEILCNHTDCPGNQVMDIMDEVRLTTGTSPAPCLHTVPDKPWYKIW